MRPDKIITERARSILRLGVLLASAGQACAQFLLLRARGRVPVLSRARWLHRSCKMGLRRLGIRVDVEGQLPSRGLLVANHLSYLDVLVFSGLAPCVFVSKKEVRGWPLFGQMARMAGTLFVDRNRSTDTPRVNGEMLEALSAGAVVVLFPEGTSSDGTSVLPFRPALFEGAIRAAAQVTPAHISYELADGSVERDICYFADMTFFPHLLRLLSKKHVRAKVRFAGAGTTYRDRKSAAQLSRRAVLELAGQERVHESNPSALDRTVAR